MANTIQIKRAASNSSSAPTLAEGELAYNEYDKELFIGASNSTLHTIGGKIGETVQGYDAGLAAIAGLTTAANKMVYTTGSDVYATTDLTSAARTLLDDTSVADMRTTLGVDAAGTNNYTLPVASDTVSGGIKVGDNLTITNGVLAADASIVINTTLTSTSDTDVLAASQGKIVKDKVDNVEDKVEAVRYLFQNKLDIIQDTNFDWDGANTDIKDEMTAIVGGNSVATTQALRDHINEVVSGYKRGDVDADGDVDINDAIEFLKYTVNNPREAFTNNILVYLLQPMYDDASTWSAYHSSGYFKTNASLPASQITESSTKRLITDTERTAWDAASDWHVLQTGADGNSIIDTVAEIVSAFESHAEGLNLISELDAKLTASSTLDGGTY
jgi:hypothetical protein